MTFRTASLSLLENKRMTAPGEPEAHEILLELFFVLNGTLHYQLEGLGDLTLSAGEYNIIYPPFLQTQPWSDRGNSHIAVFTAHLSIPYLQNWIISFPILTPFLEKAQKNIACLLSEIPGMAGPGNITPIPNILDFPHNRHPQKKHPELQKSTPPPQYLSTAPQPGPKKKTN